MILRKPKLKAQARAATSAALPAQRSYLSKFLQDHTTELEGIIRSYVARSGVAQGNDVPLLAHEVFQDMALEALAHAEKIDVNTQPWAWLLAIAVNLIKRKKVSVSKMQQREVQLSQLLATSADSPDENAFFERFAEQVTQGPEQQIIAHEAVREMLNLVSASEAQILYLAIINGFSTELLAAELQIKPSAARVRLHRALKNLREAWNQQQKREK